MRAKVEIWVPVLYAVIATAWIEVSDTVVGVLSHSVAQLTAWSMVKGFGFVVLSAVGLHAVLRWALGQERLAQHELEASKAALRETEERFRTAFQASPEAISVSRVRDGVYIAVNQSFLGMFGWTEGEVLGRSSFDIHLWENPDDRVRLIEVLERDGCVDNLEMRFRAKDGRSVPVLVSVRIVNVEGEKVLLALTRNIAEWQRAQETIRQNEARLRAFVESDVIGILFGDVDGRVYDCNQELARIIGRSRDDVLAGNVSWVDITPPEELLLDAAALAEAAEKGRCKPYEKHYLRPDGTRVPVQVGYVLLEPERQKSVAFILDITERKQAEAARRRLEAQLQQAQKLESIGRLAGGIAHDFNNLVTVINGCVEHLREELGSQGGELEADVSDIAAAAKRATTLTRQLLAFARRQVITPVPLDLNTVVSASEQLLRRVVGEDVAVVVKPCSDLWLTRCDPGQVEQVIMNLAVNARDAMPGGGTLTIEMANSGMTNGNGRKGMRPGEYVRLSVRDTGTGMAAEARQHLFEPFFTTKPTGKGTGLGLATVYGIVSQSGGHIAVDSEPGRGTTFDIFFPRTN